MHVDLNLSDLGHDHACDLLEAVCEGMVLANMLEIGADHEAFPCCIKCGELKLFVGGNQLEIEGARSIVRKGGGNALSLACFQAAARRIEKDPHAEVKIDHVERSGAVVEGEYRPLVRLKDDSYEDPEQEAIRNGGCGCDGLGHEGHDHDHQDEEYIPSGEGERNGYGHGFHVTPIQPLPIFRMPKKGTG